MKRGAASLALTSLVAALAVFAPSALAGNNAKLVVVPLPAAGDLVTDSAVARKSPSPTAPKVLLLHQFRTYDYRIQEVLAVGAKRGTDGKLWYKLSLPMRPNNTTGWVPAGDLELHHVVNRILIDIGARRMEVLRGKQVLYSTKVAVGAPGRETPTGNYYVQVRFVPTNDPFLGVFAFETSAYSKLTEWPGGGIVGIHGTDEPWLIGQAVSHGCVRMTNTAALALKQLVPLGTPITIVQD